MEKRGAPLRLALQSLRPKGYARESFAGKTANRLDEKRLATLKEFVATGMKMLDTPGVGLAFIDGGKTVWAGGLGVKEIGKPDPVGADTLFIAASNTKALTTLLLAELVDEGKMRWDQPVTDLCPRSSSGTRRRQNSTGSTSDLRVHGDAAAGHKWLFDTATKPRRRR